MLCPYCRVDNDRVIDSRAGQDGFAIRRRRECLHCGRRFTTYERLEYTLPSVTKRDGRRESFDRQKLLQSLRVACNKRPISDEELDAQVEGVERELAEEGLREVSSRALGERVMARLKNLDDVAYVRFASVYKSFRDIDEFIVEMSALVRARTTD